MITRPIPSTGEALPILGLGTWQTFDVAGREPLTPLSLVLESMQKSGGTVIDSSPMYGNAEKVIGELTDDPVWREYFFYATKVWTTGKQAGIRQMESSCEKMKRTKMDLIQVHNLTDWETQLETLKEWKAAGRVRYIGITHYKDSMHEELERLMSLERIDFVQFNYSIVSRNAEVRLLAAAAERGVATLINRPFGEGSLFAEVEGKPLPPWAAELEIQSWAEYFLKYILAHPDVTCVIPATSNPKHAADNFKSAMGTLPDQSARKKMVEYLNSL
jgi:diketogulonate reductase-like aldo/keto reductase